jgi:hypothetical protein
MNLDIPLRLSGRAAKPLVAVELRELDTSDLALLSIERGTEAVPIKRLGERHHSLARLLAQGTSPGKAAIIVGLCNSRVSVLKSDPTFIALVEFYREKVDIAYSDMHSTLAGLSLDATLVLRERLEDNPDEITVGQLLEITKMGADRTGFGPKSSQDLNVNVGLASGMQAARERVEARRRTINITPLQESSPDDLPH